MRYLIDDSEHMAVHLTEGCALLILLSILSKRNNTIVKFDGSFKIRFVFHV